ncbi:hypothetical protein N7495_006344 [Penicillium taxi]|uniref:uncharacterized protein n=1 Tax=Penicillium taxi TaxID=168475 RepID=UPI002544D883|nr:uncharacterized protein N7495_006344 [Penicillium taxi]KAJ5894653.1 hypothetical protein N7495_006344 [Penicillium taxi]
MSSGNSQNASAQIDPLLNAAKVGVLSGTVGLIYGGAAGVIRSRNPLVHSISNGIHWAVCGSTFWWLRSNIIKLHYQDDASLQERKYASAVSGGISGGLVTRLMGGRLVPGLVIFSIVGYCGQSAFNRVDAWQMARSQKPTQPLFQRMANSKWIPLRHLSDEDYREILSEKLLSVEVEISLLDEKIEGLEKAHSTGLSEDSVDSQ